MRMEEKDVVRKYVLNSAGQAVKADSSGFPMRKPDKFDPKELHRKTEAELRKIKKSGNLSDRDRERIENRLREKDRGDD